MSGLNRPNILLQYSGYKPCRSRLRTGIPVVAHLYQGRTHHLHHHAHCTGNPRYTHECRLSCQDTCHSTYHLAQLRPRDTFYLPEAVVAEAGEVEAAEAAEEAAEEVEADHPLPEYKQ